MKRLLSLIMIVMMLLMAGCAGDETDTADGRDEVSDTASDDESTENDDEKSEDKKTDTKKTNRVKKYTKSGKSKKQQKSDADIDETYFKEIGLAVSELETIYGEMSESYWDNGPIYRFGENENWYAFEQYDFAEDNSYIPLGKCNCVFVPLSKLITTGECSADTLEQALETELTEEYDEMDGGYVYSCKYDGLNISIYAQSRADIDAQSMVNIKNKE